jgi:hypothetical protein
MSQTKSIDTSFTVFPAQIENTSVRKLNAGEVLQLDDYASQGINIG